VVWVSGPTARIMDRLDEIAFATRDAAREISERIRGREHWSRRAPSPPVGCKPVTAISVSSRRALSADDQR
jgi:hypothetical protein